MALSTSRSSPIRPGRSASRPGRSARSAATPRRNVPTQGLRRRRPPEPSGIKKLLGTLLPAGAAKKAAPSSKKGKAGGLALAAAAVGVAYKNRDKLAQLSHKDSRSDGAATPPGVNNAATPPATPAI
jgi:hypothetical protein